MGDGQGGPAAYSAARNRVLQSVVTRVLVVVRPNLEATYMNDIFAKCEDEPVDSTL